MVIENGWIDGSKRQSLASARCDGGELTLNLKLRSCLIVKIADKDKEVLHSLLFQLHPPIVAHFAVSCV